MLFRRLLPLLNAPGSGLICAAALALAIGGCAAPRPAPEMVPIPGYESLQEQLTGRDLTPLHQRRIVLDPGHGGFFRGALGPNGLTEAEVNLGVALNLRGLLEWAGAEVWLTRSANTDFLSPADSTLASDLAMRVSLSDSLQPDVFLSIHHNSTPALDRTINETQTYYPLNDDGASLDLARSIHRHLVLNLGIRPASIRPGNFHVLRNATVPAVLGEPAMISHPVMAERLSLAASQRLEAEAYFLGLLDYFSGGLPAWSGAASDTVFWGADGDPTILSWTFFGNGALADSQTVTVISAGPDPAHTRLTLDGQLLTPHLSPDALTVSWPLPGNLAPTAHLLELQGRNLRGRATPSRRTLLLPRAAATVQVAIILESGRQRAGLRWFTTSGAPAPTGRLQLATGRQIPVGPGQPDQILLDGPSQDWAERQITFTATGATTAGIPCEVAVTHLTPAQQLHLVEINGRPFAPATGWQTRLGAAGQTALVTSGTDQPLWLEGAGVQPLIDPAPSDPAAPSAPAAPRTVAGSAARWTATPLLAGLLDMVIVLDPAGGGTTTDGAGPLGLRGADLNLAVAQQAAQLLRGAGAEVHLTRHDETALLPVEKVRLAGQLQADLFLTIGRRAAGESRVVRHHPGSIVGQAWAEAALIASALLPAASGSAPDTCARETASSYLLRHTACPALEWRLDLPQTAADELRQLQPGWHRAEARAVLLAITAISGHPGVFAHTLNVGEILAGLENDGGLPAGAVDWVQVDGNLIWSPLPVIAPVLGAPKSVGSSHGPGLPGLLPRHILEVHAGDRWQVWLLDQERSASGPIWRPSLLLGDASQGP